MKDDEYWVDEWNDLHIQYVKEEMEGCIAKVENGMCCMTSTKPGYRNKKMIKYCEGLILEAKKEYYAGTPIMSDGYYDKLEECLRTLDPDNSMLKKVGTDG